jgi:hypothetical protein
MHTETHHRHGHPQSRQVRPLVSANMPQHPPLPQERRLQYLAAGILQAYMVAKPIRYAGQYISNHGVIARKCAWNNVSSHDHITDGA